MRWWLALASLVGALALASAARADDNAKELEKLTGTWTVASIELGGNKTGDDEVKALRLSLIIKGKDYESKAGDNVIDKGTLKVDADSAMTATGSIR